MFNKRVNKLFKKENPLDAEKDESSQRPMEITITEVGGNFEEVPDFFKIFEEKNLTESEKDDTMEEDPSVEIEALKQLIKKLKREK